MIPSQYEDLSVIWWVGPCWSHEWHDEQQWTSCPAGQWLWGSHGWSVTRIWEKLYSISVSNALQSMNQHDFDMFWFEQNSTWFAIIVCSYMLTFTRFWCNCETPIPPKKENSTCVAPDHKPCVAPDQNEHGLSWSNYHNVHSFSSCSMFLYMFSMEPSHSARTFPWQSVASHQKKNTPAISTNLGTYLRRNFGPHGFGMSGGNSWIICHNVDTRLAPLVMFVGVSTPLLASYYAVLIIAIKPSEIGVINTPWPHANWAISLGPTGPTVGLQPWLEMHGAMTRLFLYFNV